MWCGPQKNFRGNLRRIIQIKKNAVHPTKRDSQGPVRVAVYAAVLEYGKSGQPPRPWLRKAIRETKTKVVDVVRREATKKMVEAIRDAKR